MSEATPPRVIVCLAPDLFFAPRLADVIQQLGGQPVIVATPEAFVDAVDRHFPVLALLDLACEGDWAHAITRCKIRPQTSQAPLIAFGSHVDAATLRAARRAGADHAWARSKVMAELPQIVAHYLHPPIVYPEGWDAPLSDLARRGIEEFNAGEYFEQHESFELAWREESRPVRVMHQGILQIGVAFLQIQRNNWIGAIKMFRRGLPRLRTLPPICQGVDIAAFRADAEAIHWEVTTLGATRLHEFDPGRFPRLILRESSGRDQNASKL